MQFRVSLVEGLVRRDNQLAALSPREADLMIYLAARGGPCHREEIVEALWPLRKVSGTTVLRVSILRVRSRLGNPAVIRAFHGWCSLGAVVTVDLHEIEPVVGAVASYPMKPTQRDSLIKYLEWLSRGPAGVHLGEWFAPIASRIAELRHNAAMALAEDALARRDTNAAQQFASLLLALDPCDEPARELRIRLLLARGDRAAALREYRIYRGVLASELGVEPSFFLQALLESARSNCPVLSV